MLPELTQNDFATVLDGVARDLLDQLDLSAPPVDALCVAQEQTRPGGGLRRRSVGPGKSRAAAQGQGRRRVARLDFAAA